MSYPVEAEAATLRRYSFITAAEAAENGGPLSDLLAAQEELDALVADGYRFGVPRKAVKKVLDKLAEDGRVPLMKTPKTPISLPPLRHDLGPIHKGTSTVIAASGVGPAVAPAQAAAVISNSGVIPDPAAFERAERFTPSGRPKTA